MGRAARRYCGQLESLYQGVISLIRLHSSVHDSEPQARVCGPKPGPGTQVLGTAQQVPAASELLQLVLSDTR